MHVLISSLALFSGQLQKKKKKKKKSGGKKNVGEKKADGRMRGDGARGTAEHVMWNGV